MNHNDLNTRILTVLEVAFLAFLVIRSFTEAFSGLKIYLLSLRINLSALTVLLMDGIGVLYLGLHWLRGKLKGDRLGIIFFSWTLSLSPWVILGAYLWGVPGLTGLREWIRLLSLVILYLVVRKIAQRKGHERIINACLLALPVPLSVTLYQALFTTNVRAYGVMIHPNNLAAFLVVMCAFTIYKFSNPELNMHTRTLWIGLVFLLLIALILPISSNAWLMFLVCLITFVALSKQGQWKRVGAAIGMGFLLIFLVFFLLNTPQVQREVWQALSTVGVETPTGGGTIVGRFKLWGTLFTIWQKHPFRGYGLNATPLVNPIVGYYAHNDFVRYLIEGGIFGLLLFVAFQIAVGKQLFRLRRHASNPKVQILANCALGIFLAWIAGSFGDNLISHTVFQVYFWALLAAASGAVESQSEFQPTVTPGGSGPTLFSVSRWPLLSWINRVRKTSFQSHYPICPHCHTKAYTTGSTFCQRCFSTLLGRKALLVLGALTLLVTSLTGFYLWNQGAGLETFVLTWLLWYLLLVVIFRNEGKGYYLGLLVTILIGQIAIPWLYPLEGQNFLTVSLSAFVILMGILIYGLLTSCNRTARNKPPPIWEFTPIVLAHLGLLSWLMNFLPKILHLGVSEFGGVVSRILWFLTHFYFEGLNFKIYFPGLFLGLAILSLFTIIGKKAYFILAREPDQSEKKQVFLKLTAKIIHLLKSFMDISTNFIRRYLLPVGTLLGAAFTIDYLAQKISEFIYGNPEALLPISVGLTACLLLLWLFVWGITGQKLLYTFTDVAATFCGALAMIQIAVWISTAALWGLAKALPLFSFTKGFTPLLTERSLGYYTWISLGIFMVLGVSWWTIRSRFS